MQPEDKVYVSIALVVLFLCGCGLLGYPYYKVWNASMTGKAALMRAEQEKQIAIEQAKAELESAKLRSEAIKIVGQASKEFPEYRTQEFIGAFGDAIKSGQVEQIIYVPTEANIPIVEANRHR